MRSERNSEGDRSGMNREKKTLVLEHGVGYSLMFVDIKFRLKQQLGVTYPGDIIQTQTGKH